MNHKLHSCKDSSCMVCTGGLTYCEVCHGGEGDLPTECPGRPMDEEERYRVLHGEWDFKEECWYETKRLD